MSWEVWKIERMKWTNRSECIKSKRSELTTSWSGFWSNDFRIIYSIVDDEKNNTGCLQTKNVSYYLTKLLNRAGIRNTFGMWSQVSQIGNSWIMIELEHIFRFWTNSFECDLAPNFKSKKCWLLIIIIIWHAETINNIKISIFIWRICEFFVHSKIYFIFKMC